MGLGRASPARPRRAWAMPGLSRARPGMAFPQPRLHSMPSRPLALPSPGPRRDVLLAVVVASFSALLLAVLAFLLLLFCLYRSLRRARTRDPTLPLDAPFASSLRRFSFRDLCSATASFDPSRSLGRGAFAVIFRGILPDDKSIAVKRLDHPSSSSPSSSPPQTSSDRKFHNELHVLAALPPSPFIVSLLGYYLNSPRRRLLVYEYMPNDNLQDASSPPPIIISSSAGIAGSASSSTSPRPSPSSAGIAG